MPCVAFMVMPCNSAQSPLGTVTNNMCEIITLSWQLYSYPVQVLTRAGRAPKNAPNPSELASVGCWFRLSSKTAYIFHLFIY